MFYMFTFYSGLRYSDKQDGSVGGIHSPVYHIPTGKTGYYRFSLLMSQLL